MIQQLRALAPGTCIGCLRASNAEQLEEERTYFAYTPTSLPIKRSQGRNSEVRIGAKCSTSIIPIKKTYHRLVWREYFLN